MCVVWGVGGLFGFHGVTPTIVNSKDVGPTIPSRIPGIHNRSAEDMYEVSTLGVPLGYPLGVPPGGISQESPQDLAPLLGLVGSAWAQVHSLQRQWLDSPMAKTSNCETFWGPPGCPLGCPQVNFLGVSSGIPWAAVASHANGSR